MLLMQAGIIYYYLFIIYIYYVYNIYFILVAASKPNWLRLVYVNTYFIYFYAVSVCLKCTHPQGMFVAIVYLNVYKLYF